MTGKIFYKVYFGFIVLFMILIIVLLVWLNGWLVDYEASQPEAKCEEVFDELFAKPDWGKLYEMSGCADTVFEGKEAYAEYMTQKVGDSKLTYMETSAGLSGDHKYFVKLGEEKLLWFTLTGDVPEKKGIAKWKFGEVSLIFSRSQSVKVLKKEGHTVLVNGVALDDTYTIQTSATIAENYLPEGLKGPRTVLQQADGFLTQPKVEIRDEKGDVCEVALDAETGIYTEQIEQPQISSDDEKKVWDFAENYSRYMINAYKNLSTLFDTKSKIYQVVKSSERWGLGSYKSYTFEDENLSDYYAYSDSVFSVRISLLQKVVRSNGTIKEYPMDSTVFFKRTANDGIVAFDMTNLNVLEPEYQVRLVWRNDETVWKTEMVGAVSSLTPPEVPVREGYHFTGWLRETVKEDGSVSRKLVFVPEQDGTVVLPQGYRLEPMVLYPLYEKD